MTNESQQELIIEFKDNPDVFEKVYDSYYEIIFRYLAKRTFSGEVARDLTAETFLKAFESFGKFSWKGVSIKAWLFRIAINTLKNSYRDQKYNLNFDDEILTNQPELVGDLREEIREIDRALFGDDQLTNLSDALATLKDKQQHVISLYYFSGLSYEEISSVIDKSVSSVKSLMHRGMKQLKLILIDNPDYL